MRDKIFIISLSSLFVLIMLWCPGMFLLDRAGAIELADNLNYKLPAKEYDEGALLAAPLNAIEKGKAEIENIYSNCLPMYFEITTFMLDSERAMRDAFQAAMPERKASSSDGKDTGKDGGSDEGDISTPDATATPAPTENAAPESTSAPPEIIGGTILSWDDNDTYTGGYIAKRIGQDERYHRVFWAITREGRPYSEGWIDATIDLKPDELERRVKTELLYINGIANANSKVNFYVYVAPSFQDTNAWSDVTGNIRALQDYPSLSKYVDMFLDGLDPNAVNGKGRFDIDSVGLRLSRALRTDLHQTAEGSYVMYSAIINMMAKDTPDIGEPLKLNAEKPFKDFGVTYFGGNAMASSYTEISEPFLAYNVDGLPGRPTYWNLYNYDATEPKGNHSIYEAGRFKKDTFENHYCSYNYEVSQVSYPKNDTGRNLLLFSDSYSWEVRDLIAAHFDNVVVSHLFNPRLNYNRTIREYDITDVLIMGFSHRLVFNLFEDAQYHNTVID